MQPYRKKTVFCWSLYDFANQPFTTLVVTFIYSIYFSTKIVTQCTDDIVTECTELSGQVLWSRGIALTAIIVAMLSPLMGALADRGGYRKIYLIFWTWVCVVCSCVLFYAEPGQVYKALFWFVLANVAFEMGGVFCNAFLPDLAPKEKIGRVSGYGWSFGYVGGLLALGIALIFFINTENPVFGLSTNNGENIRAITIMCGLWLAIFSLPTFIWVKEKKRIDKLTLRLIGESYGKLRQTFKEVRKYNQLFRFLIARLLYNDGLITIFAFGGLYAEEVFDFDLTDVLIFGIVLNVFAGIGSFLMGFLDDKIGGKKTIQLSNVGLILAVIIAVSVPNKDLLAISFPLIGSVTLSGSTFFWFSGILIGIFSGPNQSSSRSLMSRFIPKGRENEFFGFFAFSGKATAFIGPFLLGLLTQLFDMRAGIMVVAILLIAGYLVLKAVDEEAGTQVGNT